MNIMSDYPMSDDALSAEMSEESKREEVEEREKVEQMKEMERQRHEIASLRNELDKANKRLAEADKQKEREAEKRKEIEKKKKTEQAKKEQAKKEQAKREKAKKEQEKKEQEKKVQEKKEQEEDEKKKKQTTVISYNKYKKMRLLNGGPDSVRSYRFFKSNGFRDEEGFLESWKQRNPRPKRQLHNDNSHKNIEQHRAVQHIHVTVSGQRAVGVRI
ncbi:nucleolar protein 58-like [Clytia hemisphaerica]|uniref:nucleolar protein 58-like n=1 Tax=Clytia hemisphaerica TaxID=252671 RepID=UPI0034D4F313